MDGPEPKSVGQTHARRVQENANAEAAVVGKFVFGMLSGGALVAGGFVIGSALFPLQPSAAANDPTPVATDPAPDPVPAAATTAPDQQAEAVPEPDAEAAEPAAATPPTAEAQPEPAPDTALAPQGEPTSDATTAETAAEAAPAEVPATTPSEPTLPAAEAETADAVSDSPPVTEPVAEVPPVPAAEPEPAPPATAVVEAVDPPVIATPAADSSAETAPPAVAEVPKPDLPIAPLVLPQLDADAVLAALDDSALASPPEEAEATAVAEPEAAEPEVLAEATPEPTPEAAPETAEAAPEPAPVVEAEVEPEPAPEPASPAADAMPAPDDSATARLPGTVAPDMPGDKPDTLPGTGAGDTVPEPEVAILPEPDADAGPVFKPAPGLGDATDGVIVGRLPRIGDPPATEAETAEAEAAPVDDRPIAQFAATFENPDAKPVLAIVLIDPGTADLDREGLAALPFPVSFALDPMDPATPERAAIYRAAGKEVVMLATGIAEGAQASDIEVAFQSMAQGLPEAVAVMDLPEVVFQNRRPLASLVVPVVGTQGRGLLTWDQGLNAADQVARREDIAAAVVFRDLASAGEDSAAIRRVLDRAVFKAGQDGRVAVAGTASAATVAALLEWTVEGRAATVAIGPLTAVMTIE
jgi:hypothetical protein